MKARVPDVEALRLMLGVPEGVEEQTDTYYSHPSRDFAATDEALRVRRSAADAELTYKGPKLDATTKTRLEITAGIADPGTLHDLLVALGFGPVATVRKRREIHHRSGFEVAVDEVDGVGAYVELERRLPEGETIEAARREAFALLRGWGLTETERRSYLELLLSQGRGP